MEKNLKILMVDINLLKPATYNPRKWDEAAIIALKESISRFGIIDPIIVNNAPNRANIVIGGHFRLYVAKQLGFKEVPVVYITIAEEERERELNLRLNKNNGVWDYDLLANFDEEFLLNVGFTNEELTVAFGLNDAEKQELDYDRFNVLTVMPPESPRLKERAEIELESLEDFKKIEKAIHEGKITKEKLMEMI